jgi:hypothetical protein
MQAKAGIHQAICDIIVIAIVMEAAAEEGDEPSPINLLYAATVAMAFIIFNNSFAGFPCSVS